MHRLTISYQNGVDDPIGKVAVYHIQTFKFRKRTNIVDIIQ